VLVGAFALGNAVPFISTVGIAQGSGAVVFEVIDSIPHIDPYSKDGMQPDRIVGNIQFRNLNFNYPSRKEIPVSRQQ
jgi:ATP-binding cassette subfamily B (MDR/TAP) protein 1